MKNLNKFFALIVIVAVFIPTLTLAATMRVGEEVSLNKNNIQDDLYVAGGNISIDSVVSGDILTVGGNVMVSGDASEDMVVAGGAVTILGNSGDDMRIAGGNVLIVGDVADDLVVVGGTVTISSDTSIGGDLIVAGGQVIVAGDVVGDVKLSGGTATISGHIGGNVKSYIDKKLTITDGAIIDGNLEYNAKSIDTLVLSENSVIGGETFFNKSDSFKKDEAKNFLLAFVGTFVLIKLLIAVVVALVMVWLFKRFSNNVVKEAVRNPLRMLGKGFVVLVVTPVTAVVLLATILGAPLGVMILLSYILLLIISCVYAGVLTGIWVSQIVRKSGHIEMTWQNVIGGVILFTVLRFIPFVGWIIGLGIFLVAVGSLSQIIREKIWEDR